MAKLQLGLYWAATCGGCDVAVLDTHEKILDIAAAADILFWPIATDFKRAHVEALPDKAMDVCLFNGGVRSSEHEEMAHLLRAKSKVLVAFGACASYGGIPGLANVANREQVFHTVYKKSASTANPHGVTPQTSTQVAEGELTLPEFYDSVKTLAQTVPVDYFVPGCPPMADQIWNVVTAIVSGQLPAPGATVGASEKAMCEECPRTKDEKKIKRFVRPHMIIPEPDKCFMEQGILCAGAATRGGCGYRCIKANLPCRGCYGPPAGVADQGAKLLSAAASIIDAEEPEEIEQILAGIPDPLGYFYRFGLPNSLLRRARLQ